MKQPITKPIVAYLYFSALKLKKRCFISSNKSAPFSASTTFPALSFLSSWVNPGEFVEAFIGRLGLILQISAKIKIWLWVSYIRKFLSFRFNLRTSCPHNDKPSNTIIEKVLTQNHPKEIQIPQFRSTTVGKLLKLRAIQEGEKRLVIYYNGFYYGTKA